MIKKKYIKIVTDYDTKVTNLRILFINITAHKKGLILQYLKERTVHYERLTEVSNKTIICSS
jgi:hypothetical protein